MVGLACAIILPVIFFFVLAHMFRRSQDMRLVAETMAEVAMRLAQPETAAREQIVTVGQAIRREVAAMGDGVERALARAAELEGLVHNEVSALERAYNAKCASRLSTNSPINARLRGKSAGTCATPLPASISTCRTTSARSAICGRQGQRSAQRVTAAHRKGEHITLALAMSATA